MTPSDYSVRSRIRRGPGGAVISVRISERIDGTDEFFETACFIADLQSLPNLVLSLAHALRQAEDDSLLNDEEGIDGSSNAGKRIGAGVASKAVRS